MRHRSPLSFDIVVRNGETRKRRSIRPLCSRRATHSVPCSFFLSAPAHTNSCSFSSARKRIPIPALGLRHRASACRFNILCLQRRASACRSNILCLRRRASACRCRTSLSSGIHSRTHQPRRTWAEAQSVLVLAGTNDKIRCCCEPRRSQGFSRGHTGSALLPRSSPRQTTLAAEVLLPLLPPA